MSSTWFVWDPLSFLGVYGASLVIYLLLKYNSESKEQFRKNALWLGMAANLLSFLMVGLWCIVNVALYFASVYSINHWLKRTKKENK